jgi:multidrug resistance efflux pump
MQAMRILLTAIVVLVASVAILLKYRDYVVNPWTRDGQVRANVIQVSPGVSGPIVGLPISDNQFVKAGDEAKADDRKARAQLIQARAAKLQAEAELARAQAELGAPGEDNAKLRAAKAAVKTARLNLEFTRVMAPVDGYVTNLNLRLGSQAVANQPIMALVDVGSYWIHGFFRETQVGRMSPGERSS